MLVSKLAISKRIWQKRKLHSTPLSLFLHHFLFHSFNLIEKTKYLWIEWKRKRNVPAKADPHFPFRHSCRFFRHQKPQISTATAFRRCSPGRRRQHRHHQKSIPLLQGFWYFLGFRLFIWFFVSGLLMNDCNVDTWQVRLALESGFWTFVDMASGKYLWRHLGSSSKRSLWSGFGFVVVVLVVVKNNKWYLYHWICHVQFLVFRSGGSRNAGALSNNCKFHWRNM